MCWETEIALDCLPGAASDPPANQNSCNPRIRERAVLKQFQLEIIAPQLVNYSLT